MSNELNFEKCENESIRIPGSIQSHGSLVAYDLTSKKICYYSENIPEVALKHLTEHHPQKISAFSPHHHSYTEGDVTVYEFENPPIAPTSPNRSSLSILANLSRSQSIEDLFAHTASEIQEFTGFDRVMVYRFDADWNGVVIAEAKTIELESFLDLHFPASDIPAQARELYQTNWIRLIPDVNYRPVPILSVGKNTPLDLSQSRFRSVSPIHIQYLKNMQVAASMSISIIEDGKLWGLIACHHRSPKLLSQQQLDDCETLGRFVSLQIAVKEKSELAQYQDHQKATIEDLESLADGLDAIFKDHSKHSDSLLNLVSAAGVAYVKGTEVHSHGLAPDFQSNLKIVNWLKTFHSNQSIFYTDKLGLELPELKSISSSSPGLLSLKLPDIEASYLLWFRPEQRQNVRWAGNPNKNQNDPLTPRNSFAEWSELVSGKSKAWKKHELEVAREFLQSLIKHNLIRQIKLEKNARSAAEESNRELDFFSFIVSHDLKEPIRGIKHFSHFVQEDEAASLSIESKENLTQISALADRMGMILDSLLDYSKIGMTELGKSEVDLDAEVRKLIASMRFSIEQRHARVEIVGQLPSVFCDPVRSIQVFQNLISNALKYNSNQNPKIEISAETRMGISEFRICDDGIGIDSEHFSKIFESFIRLPGAQKFGEGTGMGLTIAKRIVEKHHGQIKVESPSHRGTCFRFTLAPTSEVDYQ